MSEHTPDDRPRPVPGPPGAGPRPDADRGPVPGPPTTSDPVPGPPASGDQTAGSTDGLNRPAPDLGDEATGDIVIDAALQDLRDAPADDLDAQIEAGRRVHQTLQGRLSHLGGE